LQSRFWLGKLFDAKFLLPLSQIQSRLLNFMAFLCRTLHLLSPWQVWLLWLGLPLSQN
jgi:hypothetical protein